MTVTSVFLPPSCSVASLLLSVSSDDEDEELDEDEGDDKLTVTAGSVTTLVVV